MTPNETIAALVAKVYATLLQYAELGTLNAAARDASPSTWKAHWKRGRSRFEL